MKWLARHLAPIAAFAIVGAALTTQAQAGDLTGALKYVPSNFTTVVGINLDQLGTSGLAKTLRDSAVSSAGVGGDLKTLKKETGFDPKTDVETLVLAGPSKLFSDEGHFVMIGKAKIDADKVIDYIKRSGATVTEAKVGAGTVYNIDKGGKALAFHDGFVIAGPKALVDEAMKARAGAGAASGKLGSQIKRLHGSKSAFAVLRPNKKVKDTLGQLDPSLSSFSVAGVGISIGTTLDLDISVTFGTADAATKMVETALAMVKDGVESGDLPPMASKLAIKAEGKDVHITVSLSSEESSGLMEAFMP